MKLPRWLRRKRLEEEEELEEWAQPHIAIHKMHGEIDFAWAAEHQRAARRDIGITSEEVDGGMYQ